MGNLPRRKTAVLLLLAGVATVCVSLFGATLWIKHRLAVELSTLNGGKVEMGQVRIRASGLQVSDVVLHETGAKAPVWMRVEQLTIEASPTELLREQPQVRRLQLLKPQLRIRVGSDGKILTRLPSQSAASLPAGQASLSGGSVTLIQQSRNRELVASGIDLRAVPDAKDEGTIRISGKAESFLGGRWSLAGHLGDDGEVNAQAETTSRLDLEQLLETLPIESHIRDVELHGSVSVEAAVKRLPDSTVDYFVRLRPHSASLSTRSGIGVRDLKGTLQLSNGTISTADLRSSAFGGQVTAAFELNLSERPVEGAVSLVLTEIAVEQLPSQVWVPTELTGRLSGETELALTATTEKIRFRGGGSGRVDRIQLGDTSLGSSQVQLNLQEFEYDLNRASAVSDGELRMSVSSDALPLKALLDDLKIEGLQGQAGETVSLHGDLRIPLNAVNDPLAYTATAELSAPLFSTFIGDVTNVRAISEFREGKVGIRSLTADYGSGRVQAEGSVELAPGGRVDLQLSLEGVSLEKLRARLATAPHVGAVTGSLWLTCPTDKWEDPQQWSAGGEVQLHGLELADTSVSDAAASLALQSGVLNLQDVQGRWNGVPLSGRGTVELLPPHRFSFQADSQRTDLADLAASVGAHPPLKLSAKLRARAEGDGQLSPFEVSAAGDGELTGVRIEGAEVPDWDFNWSLESGVLQVATDAQTMFDGQVSLEAKVTLDPLPQGVATVTANSVALSQLRRIVPEFPASLQGSAEGRVVISGSGSELTAEGQFASSQVRWNQLAIDDTTASFAFADSQLGYNLQGEFAGGKLTFSGETNLAESANTAIAGRLSLAGAQLERADPAKAGFRLPPRLQNAVRQMTGTVGTELDITANDFESRPDVRGTINLENLRWSGVPLTQRVRAAIDISPTTLQVKEFETRLGDGILRGDLNYQLEPHRGTARLSGERIEVARLLAPWPSISKNAAGTADVVIRADLGASWSGTADISTSQAEIVGVEFAVERLPISWTATPATGSARLQMRTESLRVAGGRVSGKAVVAVSRGVNLDVAARLRALQLRNLLRGNSRFSANGQLGGQLTLRGRNLQSLSDLRGSFRGNLTNSRTLGLPVLRSLNRHLNTGPLLSQSFDSTEVRLRLDRGIVSVDRLALSDSAVQLIIEGRADLKGRLDLNATAHVGQFSSEPQLSRLLQSAGLFAQSAAPVALLAEANEFLSDRLLYLHIGGTVRNPTTRLQSGLLLRQEAVRFFLGEAGFAVPRLSN